MRPSRIDLYPVEGLPSDQNRYSRVSRSGGVGGDHTTTGHKRPSIFPVAIQPCRQTASWKI